MKKLFLFVTFACLVYAGGVAQSLDSLVNLGRDNKLLGNIDNDLLAFNTGQNFEKLLNNPFEHKNLKEFSGKLTLGENDKIQGVVTPAPVDNMPVLRPMGNFPNRNYYPDPRHQYPMPVLRPELIKTPLVGK